MAATATRTMKVSLSGGQVGYFLESGAIVNPSGGAGTVFLQTTLSRINGFSSGEIGTVAGSSTPVISGTLTTDGSFSVSNGQILATMGTVERSYFYQLIGV